ncbi:MAG TPA: hypothetical protein VKE70_28850 [Candidatus Solibacter sp.]|nr:hypothetical protein [Candidatus Solibacter sp.]
MIPQSNLTLVAPIAAGREAALRSLLAGMNRQPGDVEPQNSVLPFARFDELHFARLVILDDQTTGDIAVYDQAAPSYPLYLAFLADFDGFYDEFVTRLISIADLGLRRIFAHCEGFDETTDIRTWMKAREHPAAAAYVNWIGRTVQQSRQEARLRNALVDYLAKARDVAEKPAAQLHGTLREYARKNGLMPEAEPKTPVLWWIGNKLHALVMAPILLLGLILWGPVLLVALRSHENSDPVVAPPPDRTLAKKLAEIEDHGVTNQFSAMGSFKPGLFRRWTAVLLLAAIDYTARHIYNKGALARVHSIHFARWVFIDNKKRMLFASNYDGSLESYMDDFINKVAFGLNVVFSNGVGYPFTRWLLCEGAKDEQKFKHFIRRHELVTEVWYNAHAGLSANDLRRNGIIRQRLEADTLTDGQACELAALL